jgi:acyl-CoA synthetase (AMP-forming)/AMP-acid ligase II
VSTAASRAELGMFIPGPTVRVLDPDRTRFVAPGEDVVGWFAKSGRIPLGYLGDQTKTQATFSAVDGVRYVVVGDRARLRADGMVELLGRDSVTINSGGEKIFAEEVEQALITHPDVVDAVVTGRPSERWGQEVVAVVQVRDGSTPSDESIIDAAATRIARYKLPKAIVRVEKVLRSPAGKADYAWAKQQMT